MNVFGGTLSRGPGRLNAVFGIPRALEQPRRRGGTSLTTCAASVHGAGARPRFSRAVLPASRHRHAAPIARVDLPSGTCSRSREAARPACAGAVLVSSARAVRPELSARRAVSSCSGRPTASSRTGYGAPCSGCLAARERSAALRGRERELDVPMSIARADAGQVSVFIAERLAWTSRLLAECRGRLRPGRTLVRRTLRAYGTGTPFAPHRRTARFLATRRTTRRARAPISLASSRGSAPTRGTLSLIRPIFRFAPATMRSAISIGEPRSVSSRAPRPHSGAA